MIGISSLVLLVADGAVVSRVLTGECRVDLFAQLLDRAGVSPLRSGESVFKEFAASARSAAANRVFCGWDDAVRRLLTLLFPPCGPLMGRSAGMLPTPGRVR